MTEGKVSFIEVVVGMVLQLVSTIIFNSSLITGSPTTHIDMGRANFLIDVMTNARDIAAKASMDGKFKTWDNLSIF